jgi:hypothetical protein
MAEPALAQRDAKRRATLRGIVGKSDKRAKAITLMNGTKAQSVISKESGLDAGNLSRLVKSLSEADLIAADTKIPMLILKVPPTFFEEHEPDE